MKSLASLRKRGLHSRELVPVARVFLSANLRLAVNYDSANEGQGRSDERQPIDRWTTEKSALLSSLFRFRIAPGVGR
jgi:hypothetical protein